MEVLKGSRVKIVADVSIPTDRALEARRPDLVVCLRYLQTILILEVACAHEKCLSEREEQKREKY